MRRHPIDRWEPWHVGISHTNGPQPLRSAEDDEPDYVPPPKRTIPFGFAVAVEPDPEDDMPDLWDGDNG